MAAAGIPSQGGAKKAETTFVASIFDAGPSAKQNAAEAPPRTRLPRTATVLGLTI